jgi:hypothetical protein
MKEYNVYLYRAPECIRGWLAYLRNESTPTICVRLEAESGAKAKNKAQTLANKGFEGLQILSIPITNTMWDIGNFPELHYLLERENI